MLRIISILAISLFLSPNSFAVGNLSEAYCRDLTHDKTIKIIQLNPYLDEMQSDIEDSIYFSCLHAKRAGLSVNVFKNARPLMCIIKSQNQTVKSDLEVIHLDLEFRKWFLTDINYNQLPELYTMKGYQEHFTNKEFILDNSKKLLIPHSYLINSSGVYDGVLIEQTTNRRNIYELDCYELNRLEDKAGIFFT